MTNLNLSPNELLLITSIAFALIAFAYRMVYLFSKKDNGESNQ